MYLIEELYGEGDSNTAEFFRAVCLTEQQAINYLNKKYNNIYKIYLSIEQSLSMIDYSDHRLRFKITKLKIDNLMLIKDDKNT